METSVIDNNIISDYNQTPVLALASDRLRVYMDPTGLYPDGTILSDVDGVVCPVFPTPSEDLSSLKADWNPNELLYQEAGDGTLIRAFFWDDAWRIATNNSLEMDHVNSKLGHTKSFLEMTQEALLITQLVLDKSFVYFWLLEHPDNTIYLDHKVPRLREIAVLRVKQTAPYYESVELKNVLSAEDVARLFPDRDEWSSTDSVVLTAPIKTVGLIIAKKNQDGSVQRFRQNTPEYRAALKLRGKVTDKRFRVLEILCGKESDDEKTAKLNQFLTVFPFYLPIYTHLNQDMGRLDQLVCELYMLQFLQIEPRHFKRAVLAKAMPLFNAVLRSLKTELRDYAKSDIKPELIITAFHQQDTKRVAHLVWVGQPFYTTIL
jgi:hypothetical protein